VAENTQAIINTLRTKNQQVPVPLELPTEDQIVEAEEAIFLPIDRELRQFLLTVSDIIYGSLEPITVTDPGSHTYLPSLAAQAWAEGVPRDTIPICATANGYYCCDAAGEIQLWKDGDFANTAPWSDIWSWVSQVWLTS
jgi:hypothetical protein